MVHPSQRRYSDAEMLAMLQLFASDYNKRPTHRKILKEERLPTHHTYIRRFGSLQEAFRLANLEGMEDDDTTHDAVKQLLGDREFEEWVPLGPGTIIADFRVEERGEVYIIDIVTLPGVREDSAEKIRELRRLVAEGNLREGEKYVQVKDISDFVRWLQRH